MDQTLNLSAHLSCLLTSIPYIHITLDDLLTQNIGRHGTDLAITEHSIAHGPCRKGWKQLQDCLISTIAECIDKIKSLC